MRTKDEAMFAFTPVGKLGDVQKNCILRVESAFKDLAAEVYDLVPECPDRTAAVRKLLESKMTCIQAISHSIVTEVSDNGKKAKKKDAPQA